MQQKMIVDRTPLIGSTAVTYRSIRQSTFRLCAFRRTQNFAHGRFYKRVNDEELTGPPASYLSILTTINATDAFWCNIRLKEIEVISPLFYLP
ncbi:hypothetical protein CN933_29860 [Sinorhizobium sp. M4_45]|nr:hypothetical protein C770_GR4pC1139 [Sinorhizobium meliloti GR4]PND23944.1 hypothetical protein CN933_29860 [Sinorhizobium sp. M4_45]